MQVPLADEAVTLRCRAEAGECVACKQAFTATARRIAVAAELSPSGTALEVKTVYAVGQGKWVPNVGIVSQAPVFYSKLRAAVEDVSRLATMAVAITRIGTIESTRYAFEVVADDITLEDMEDYAQDLEHWLDDMGSRSSYERVFGRGSGHDQELMPF
jgi:hypothetical protein